MSGTFNSIQRLVGKGLLVFPHFSMKTLPIAVSASKFLVGGRILVHYIRYILCIHYIRIWL
jgi:predicted DNA repair protein MutK